VYDHVNGGMVNVYPIWIEKTDKAYKYEKITFSDGTVLKVVNSHALFDVNRKKFIDVSNSEEFNIGTSVYKIENDKLKIVNVTNIEYIDEEVKYYHIVSTQYYNVIANDLLTSDILSGTCNIYGYAEDALYPESYKEICKGKRLDYKYINGLPYYLFKGLNLENGIELIKRMNTEFLFNYLTTNLKEPITKNNSRYFIITTSEDEVTNKNIGAFLYREGSFYKVPYINGEKYYKDTSSKKIYKSGDLIKVTNSIHLELQNNKI